MARMDKRERKEILGDWGVRGENAREGCVRETFGALIAMHQAERAGDPIIRRAMRRIAEEETRHAELAWEVASWSASNPARRKRWIGCRRT